jgi:small subunit ribosomal protein S3
MIIGKGGKTIKQLAQVFEKFFNLENPQITVTNVDNPELNARVMAFRLAVALEKGYHFRRAAFITIRRIMNAGALGAEVVVSGKITSERAKYEKLKEGTVYKTGNSLETMIDRAVAIATLKPGIYGVEIIIAKPLRPVDKISFKETPAPSAGEVTVTNVKIIDENTGGAQNAAEELRKMDIKDLYKKLDEYNAELLKYRAESRMGTLKNTSAIKNVRKDIARILTIISEKKRSKKNEKTA